jgi:hypothetical protein
MAMFSAAPENTGLSVVPSRCELCLSTHNKTGSYLTCSRQSCPSKPHSMHLSCSPSSLPTPRVVFLSYKCYSPHLKRPSTIPVETRQCPSSSTQLPAPGCATRNAQRPDRPGNCLEKGFSQASARPIRTALSTRPHPLELKQGNAFQGNRRSRSPLSPVRPPYWDFSRAPQGQGRSPTPADTASRRSRTSFPPPDYVGGIPRTVKQM